MEGVGGGHFGRLMLRLWRVVDSCWLGDKGEFEVSEVEEIEFAYREAYPRELHGSLGDAGSGRRPRNGGSVVPLSHRHLSMLSGKSPAMLARA